MDVLFLGGASGVGASCLALPLGPRWVVVDAGVRMDRGVDRLPDLAQLDGKDVAAIFVTHAHADHIGALPLVHQTFPNVPIYASLPTLRLMDVMLADAVRIMSRRAAEELEIPLFDADVVAAMLRCVRPLPLSGSTQVPELPEVTIHTVQAGHVAGAIMLGFEAPTGRVLISGDVSMTPQRTIRGAGLPTLKHPDLLILESTYGARLHANRQAEEQRLAQTVAAQVQQGHVLIPAFALGRAQEVLMILQRAQRDHQIPEFPIWVDGLVRAVCAAYESFPQALAPALSRHLQNGGRAFFSRSVRPVESPAQRETILQGPPSCIVASSGMLTGGPSAWFAARLAGDERAAILITGYQDEETPGRKLQAAAANGGGTIELEGRSLPLRCRVDTYGLSAHADGHELAGLVRAIKPRMTALVHGDAEARAVLGARIKELTHVVLPSDGGSLTIKTRDRSGPAVSSRSASAERREPIGDGAPLDLQCLWQHLDDGTGVPTVSVRDVVRLWWGEAAPADAEQDAAAALVEAQPYFVELPGVPGLYRVRSATEVRRAQAAGVRATATTARPDQTALLALVQQHLGDAPDLYHRGVDPESGAITLSFHFPDVARARYAQAIQTVQDAAGVAVRIAPQPHQGALAQAALAVLPAGLIVERTPSIRFEQRVVALRCVGSAPVAAIAAAQQQFYEETAWSLEVTCRAADGGTVSVSGSAPPRALQHRLEYNAALALARALFPPETGCYKIGADQQAGMLLLRFHFPGPAQTRWAEQLRALADQTGWQVAVHPLEHQGALEAEVRRVLPDQATLVGAPSLHRERREVVARYRGALTPAEIAAAGSAFAAVTGWTLQLRPAGAPE
ncbi:MAG TPA: MBL fold metallo-hydrolase [Herpetosiphonaceae bacterium]